MEKNKWLVINYNLPTEPSRHRVAVWRALKKLGAVNIQQSMWLLIYSEDNYTALKKISRDIEEFSGEALLMESSFCHELHEKRILSLFNDIRNDEYKELISECSKYLKELEKEIKIEKFTFAELEEEEAELEKLIQWYGRIQARDIFHASGQSSAEVILEEIRKAFDNYSELVYRHNQK